VGNLQGDGLDLWRTRSKLTPQMRERVAKLIQTGLTVEVVAGAVGISEPTFYAWMVRGEGARAADAPYRAFREAVEAARAEHEAILGRLTTPKSGRVRAVPMAPDVAAAIAHWVGRTVGPGATISSSSGMGVATSMVQLCGGAMRRRCYEQGCSRIGQPPHPPRRPTPETRSALHPPPHTPRSTSPSDQRCRRP
jgi:transposase-like protein